MGNLIEFILSKLPFNGDKTKIGLWGSGLIIVLQLLCVFGVKEACDLAPDLKTLLTFLGISVVGLGHKKLKKLKAQQ